MQDAKVTTYVDDIADRLIVRLDAEVLSHKVADSSYTMTVPYPSTPWQHFRHKHQSKWWMRRSVKRNPIDYTHKQATVTLNKSYRFPESTIRFPNHLGPIVVVEQGELNYAMPDYSCGCPERQANANQI